MLSCFASLKCPYQQGQALILEDDKGADIFSSHDRPILIACELSWSLLVVQCPRLVFAYAWLKRDPSPTSPTRHAALPENLSQIRPLLSP